MARHLEQGTLRAKHLDDLFVEIWLLCLTRPACFCLLDHLFGRAGLRRISHGPGVTVGGVIGRNLQPLGSGSALQHGCFGDLLISFLGLPVFRLGRETDVSITPAFCGCHETFILLLRKVPNYDIQIGVRHRLFPQMPSEHSIRSSMQLPGVLCNYAADECHACAGYDGSW
jgi:hypothetical protein